MQFLRYFSATKPEVKAILKKCLKEWVAVEIFTNNEEVESEFNALLRGLRGIQHYRAKCYDPKGGLKEERKYFLPVFVFLPFLCRVLPGISSHIRRV